MEEIIDMIIDKAIKISSCSICQDDIYRDDKNIKFCCEQIYHEKCLAEYIGLNMYAKCPICHKWVTKEVKEAFDIIFDKEYKLEYYREKIKQTKEFTQDTSFYNERSTNMRRHTSPITTNTPLLTAITERLPLIPRLDLNMVPRRPYTRMPSPPRAPRNRIDPEIFRQLQELYTIMDDYGERTLTEEDYINFLYRNFN